MNTLIISTSRASDAVRAAMMLFMAAALTAGLAGFLLMKKKKNRRINADEKSYKRQIYFHKSINKVKEKKAHDAAGISKTSPAFENESTIASLTPERDIQIEFNIMFEGTSVAVLRRLTSSLILGRGTGCDVDVVLGEVSESSKLTSRCHASIIRRGGGVFIRDENTINHTYLNGRIISGEVPLADRDEIRMGRARVKVNIIREGEEKRRGI